MLSWIEIDQARLRGNIEAFKKIIGSDTAMMAVIKANAYGHGLATVASILQDHVDWFGVNCLDEALAITQTGVQKPIVILGHTPIDRLDVAVRNGYRQVLYRLDVARALSR